MAAPVEKDAHGIFIDDYILVICPYCEELHKHGNNGTRHRQSECHKGNYIIKPLKTKSLVSALKMRDRELLKKHNRWLRQKNSSTQSVDNSTESE